MHDLFRTRLAFVAGFSAAVVLMAMAIIIGPFEWRMTASRYVGGFALWSMVAVLSLVSLAWPARPQGRWGVIGLLIVFQPLIGAIVWSSSHDEVSVAFGPLVAALHTAWLLIVPILLGLLLLSVERLNFRRKKESHHVSTSPS